MNQTAAIVVSVMTATLVLCAWGEAGAQEPVERRVVLLPVEFAGQGDGPPVANYVEDVQTGLSRNYSGEIIAGERLVQAMEGAWVLRGQEAALSRMEADVKAAVEVFYQDGGGAAIPKLEPIVAQADKLLPAASGDPVRARELLKAHLFLWWSFRQVGEEAQLPTLMARTAERFPSAVVSSVEMPPYVAQAFNQAREEQRTAGATLSVYLTTRDHEGCQILVDGFAHGDGRSAGLSVRTGRTYYVTGKCGQVTLPPRRVVVQGPTEVRLDMVLADRLEVNKAQVALKADMSPEAVGELTDLAVAGGRALSAGQVVLVSVVERGGGLELQLDRVAMRGGRRICSVRMPLGPDVAPGAIDAAVRALIVGKPTPTPILFAGDDHVYRTPDEYVEYVTDEGIHRIFTWVTLGITAGTLITAGSLELVAQSDQNNLTNCIKALSCRGTREAEDLRTDLNDTLVTRDVLYITSGVFAITSAILYFVEAPDPSDYLAADPAPSLRPWVSRGAAGADFTLRF